MLHEIYIQQRLAKLAGRRTTSSQAQALAVANLLRQRSLLRRAARGAGVLLVNIGAQLAAYGSDGRLSQPVPPIVDAQPLT